MSNSPVRGCWVGGTPSGLCRGTEQLQHHFCSNTPPVGTLAFQDLETQAKAPLELQGWDPGPASLAVKGRMPPAASAGGGGGGVEGHSRALAGHRTWNSSSEHERWGGISRKSILGIPNPLINHIHAPLGLCRAGAVQQQWRLSSHEHQM